jgi:hypothetical protein
LAITIGAADLRGASVLTMQSRQAWRALEPQVGAPSHLLIS